MKYLRLILQALVSFNNDQWDREVLRERELAGPARRRERKERRESSLRVGGF